MAKYTSITEDDLKRVSRYEASGDNLDTYRPPYHQTFKGDIKTESRIPDIGLLRNVKDANLVCNKEEPIVRIRSSILEDIILRQKYPADIEKFNKRNLYSFEELLLELDIRDRTDYPNLLFKMISGYSNKVKERHFQPIQQSQEMQALFLGQSRPFKVKTIHFEKDTQQMNSLMIAIGKVRETQSDREPRIYGNLEVTSDERGFVEVSIGDYVIYENQKFGLIKNIKTGVWDFSYSTILNHFLIMTESLKNLFLYRDIRRSPRHLSKAAFLITELLAMEMPWNDKVDVMATWEQILLSAVDYRTSNEKVAYVYHLKKLDKLYANPISIHNAFVKKNRIFNSTSPGERWIVHLVDLMFNEEVVYDVTELCNLSSMHKCCFFAYVDTRQSLQRYIDKQRDKIRSNPEDIHLVVRMMRGYHALKYYRRYNVYPKMKGDKRAIAAVKVLMDSRNYTNLRINHYEVFENITIWDLYKRTGSSDSIHHITDKKITRDDFSGFNCTMNEVQYVLDKQEGIEMVTPVQLMHEEGLIDFEKEPEDQIYPFVTKRLAHPQEVTYDSGFLSKFAIKGREQKVDKGVGVGRLYAITSYDVKKSLSFVQNMIMQSTGDRKEFDMIGLKPVDLERIMNDDSVELARSKDSYAVMSDLSSHNLCMTVEVTSEAWGEVGRWFGYSNWRYMPLIFNRLTYLHYSDSDMKYYEVKGINSGVEGMQVYFWSLFTAFCMDYVRTKMERGITFTQNRVYNDDMYCIVDKAGAQTEDIVMDIQKTLRKVGLKMKLEQTRLSKTTVSLLKKHHYMGFKADSDLKKILSISPYTNSLINDIGLLAKSISGGIQSSLQDSSRPGEINTLKIYELTKLFRYNTDRIFSVENVLRFPLDSGVKMEFCIRKIFGLDGYMLDSAVDSRIEAVKRFREAESPTRGYLTQKNNSSREQQQYKDKLQNLIRGDNLEKLMRRHNIDDDREFDEVARSIKTYRLTNRNPVFDYAISSGLYYLIMYSPTVLGGWGIPTLSELFISGYEDNMQGKLITVQRLLDIVNSNLSVLSIIDKKPLPDENEKKKDKDFPEDLINSNYAGIKKTKTIDSEIKRSLLEHFKKQWNGKPRVMTSEEIQEVTDLIVLANRENFSQVVLSKLNELGAHKLIDQMLSPIASASSNLSILKFCYSIDFDVVTEETGQELVDKALTSPRTKPTGHEIERYIRNARLGYYEAYGINLIDPHRYNLEKFIRLAKDGEIPDITVSKRDANANLLKKKFAPVKPKFTPFKDLCAGTGDDWTNELILSIVRYCKWVILKSCSNKHKRVSYNNIEKTANILISTYDSNMTYSKLESMIHAPETGQILHRMDTYRHKVTVKFSGLNSQLLDVSSFLLTAGINKDYGPDHNVNLALMEAQSIIDYCLLKLYAGYKNNTMRFMYDKVGLTDVSQVDFLCVNEADDAVSFDPTYPVKLEYISTLSFNYSGDFDESIINVQGRKHGYVPTDRKSSELEATSLYHSYLNYKSENPDIIPKPSLLTDTLIESMKSGISDKSPDQVRDILVEIHEQAKVISIFDTEVSQKKHQGEITDRCCKAMNMKPSEMIRNCIANSNWEIGDDGKKEIIIGPRLNLVERVDRSRGAKLGKGGEWSVILEEFYREFDIKGKELIEFIRKYLSETTHSILRKHTPFEYEQKVDSKIVVDHPQVYNRSCYDVVQSAIGSEDPYWKLKNRINTSLYSIGKPRESTTMSGAFHSQYHLLRMLEKKKIIDKECVIVDLCAGRGDGRLAANVRELYNFYSYSRGDPWDLTICAPDIEYISSLDAMNVHTYPFKYEESEVVLIDLSFQKGTAGFFQNALLHMLKKNKIAIFREGLLRHLEMGAFKDQALFLIYQNNPKFYLSTAYCMFMTKEKSKNYKIPTGNLIEVKKSIDRPMIERSHLSLECENPVIEYNKACAVYVNEKNLVAIVKGIRLEIPYTERFTCLSSSDSSYFSVNKKIVPLFPNKPTDKLYRFYKVAVRKDYVYEVGDKPPTQEMVNKAFSFIKYKVLQSKSLCESGGLSHADEDFINALFEDKHLDGINIIVTGYYEQNMSEYLVEHLYNSDVDPRKYRGTEESDMYIHPINLNMPSACFNQYIYKCSFSGIPQVKEESEDMFNMFSSILLEYEVTNHPSSSQIYNRLKRSKDNLDSGISRLKNRERRLCRKLNNKIDKSEVLKAITSRVVTPEKVAKYIDDVAEAKSNELFFVERMIKNYITFKGHLIYLFQTADKRDREIMKDLLRSQLVDKTVTIFNSSVCKDNICVLNLLSKGIIKQEHIRFEEEDEIDEEQDEEDNRILEDLDRHIRAAADGVDGENIVKGLLEEHCKVPEPELFVEEVSDVSDEEEAPVAFHKERACKSVARRMILEDKTREELMTEINNATLDVRAYNYVASAVGYYSKAAIKLKEIIFHYPQVMETDKIAADLGSGPGGWTQVLCEYGFRVDGLDVTSPKERYLAIGDVNFINDDVRRMPSYLGQEFGRIESFTKMLVCSDLYKFSENDEDVMGYIVSFVFNFAEIGSNVILKMMFDGDENRISETLGFEFEDVFKSRYKEKSEERYFVGINLTRKGRRR